MTASSDGRPNQKTLIVAVSRFLAERQLTIPSVLALVFLSSGNAIRHHDGTILLHSIKLKNFTSRRIRFWNNISLVIIVLLS